MYCTVEFVLRCTIGLLWSIAGVSKLVELYGGVSAADNTQNWSSEFPVSSLIAIAFVECVIGALFIGRWMRSALLLSSLMLLAFLAALWVWPPDIEQHCGCFGSISLFDQVEPVVKVIFFAGLHSLAGVVSVISTSNVSTARMNRVQSAD